eukprot:11785088-Karenia_brevis.AAC.1
MEHGVIPTHSVHQYYLAVVPLSKTGTILWMLASHCCKYHCLLHRLGLRWIHKALMLTPELWP